MLALELPSPCHPTPLGHLRAPSWAPCVIYQLPTSSLFHTWLCIYVRATCSNLPCSPPPNNLLPSQPALSDSLASYTEGRTKWDLLQMVAPNYSEEPTPVKNLDSEPWIPQGSFYCINLQSSWLRRGCRPGPGGGLTCSWVIFCSSFSHAAWSSSSL